MKLHSVVLLIGFICLLGDYTGYFYTKPIIIVGFFLFGLILLYFHVHNKNKRDRMPKPVYYQNPLPQ